MPAAKIKSLRISGLRGVKDEMTLPLAEKSIVIYGDNGAGKSSITDVVEWFYYGKIAHLSSEEIGKQGLEALRNFCVPDDKDCLLEVKYSDVALDCSKHIQVNKGALKSEYDNKNAAFADFLKASEKENILLRYNQLVRFILSTKAEKLSDLSDIIGFAEVTNTRSVLKKALNDIAKELKNKNFDGAINTQQANLLKQLRQNITSEEHFIKAISELVSPLKLGTKVEALKDIDAVVAAIKKPVDQAIIEQQSFYAKVNDVASNFSSKLDSINTSYNEYEGQYAKLAEDVESLKKIFLSNLLEAGKSLLESGRYKDNNCPLCLRQKDAGQLLKETLQRLEEIKTIRAEQSKLSKLKSQTEALINENTHELNGLLKSKYILEPGNAELKTKIESLRTALLGYLQETAVDIGSGKRLKTSADLRIGDGVLSEIAVHCSQKHDQLKAQIKDDKFTDTVVKIELSKSAYSQIKTLKREKELIEKQKASFEIVYSEFVKKQKEGLQSFINNFSEAINEYYQFMNPAEQVKGIKLITIENQEELIGLTVTFKFINDAEVCPPQKYFSESHLNCFGLAFYLASVKAFNKKNSFIVLDDVISSFDANHRKRFADLLIEKFSDYQIILLTHERQWFEYVRSIVKSKNWLVKEIKWSEAKGTHLDESETDLRQKIEVKMASNTEDDLGNNIRAYLEHILKDIAYNLKVKVAFQFNDSNENRMCSEMLSELKGKLSKSSSDLATQDALLDRASNSIFIGNKDSHDSSFKPSMGDLKAFWQDVQDIENLFLCTGCKKHVSTKYYDTGIKKIKCKCGSLSYSWKL